MYRVRIDAASGIGIIELEGEISLQDLRACFRELSARPDFSPGLAGVADLRRATLALDEREAERLAREVVDGGVELGRWALLTDAPLTTALTVLYEEIASELSPHEVFSTVEGASTFLHVDLRRLLKS